MKWWLALALLVPATTSWAQAAAAAPAAPSSNVVAHVSEIAQLYVSVGWDPEHTREQVSRLAGELHPAIVEAVTSSMRSELAAAVRKQRRFARTIFPCVQNAQDWQQVPDEELLTTAMELRLEIPAPLVFSKVKTEFVGVVPEGDELLHVLLRSSWADAPRPDQPEEFLDSEVSVVSFKRSGGDWKLLIGNPDSAIGFASDQIGKYGVGKAAISGWCPTQHAK